MQMLENGEAFSLRAVARSAGVSPTAPYRHFADRDALESALAAEGFTDKSLAIAHGLGDLYVEPEAAPKKTRGKKNAGSDE